MDWFNWSNDADEVSPKIAKFNEIEIYVDDKFGSYNYFGIRSFVKSAMDNTLHVEYPNTPYSAKEIIEWAEYNDNESYFFTAGGQAIDGETYSDEVLGAPDINPRTGKKNTQAVKDGAILSAVKSGTTSIVFIGLAAALFYTYANAKVKKAA